MERDLCSYQVHLPDTGTLGPVLAAMKELNSTLLSDYLWHHGQGFVLRRSGATALRGRNDVTDCVDDEWLLVYVLLELTRRVDGIVASITDTDGEFLLIEAAPVLPREYTPDNSENRVWLFQGEIHLVPLQYTTPRLVEEVYTLDERDQASYIDPEYALRLVRDPKTRTLAPDNVREAIIGRIREYPGKIREHLHHTLTYLPADIARALSQVPSLVVEAVGAFYERDPSGLKPCNEMARFPPGPPSEAFAEEPATVFVQTTLTRPLYAQLLMQKFYCPKPFEKVGWLDNAKEEADIRRRTMGMKIACGFEMLYQATKNETDAMTTDSDDDAYEKAKTDPKYQHYLALLTKNMYFQGELEGSQKWNSLESQFRREWVLATTAKNSDEDEDSKASFARRVDEAIKGSNASQIKERITKPVSEDQITMLELEDGESWLTMDEQGLEDLLNSRAISDGELSELSFDDYSSEEDEPMDEKMATSVGNAEGSSAPSNNKNKAPQPSREEKAKVKKISRKLGRMARKVERFVEGEGALDGALFGDEVESDGADDDDDDDDKMDIDEPQSAPKELVAGLAPEEWGRKQVKKRAAPEEILKKEDVIPAPSAPPRVGQENKGKERLTREDQLKIRPPKLTVNKYDGVSSDSSSEEEAEPEDVPAPTADLASDDEEDNDSEILNMGEEMDDFLAFATEALGLTKEQYASILEERKSRGAPIPVPGKAKAVNVIKEPETKAYKEEAKDKRQKTAPNTAAATEEATSSTEKEAKKSIDFKDFDVLMDQLDSELQRARNEKSYKKKGSEAQNGQTQPAQMESDDSADEMDAMDAELTEALKNMNTGHGDAGPDFGDSGDVDYNLIKNFLMSVSSQPGAGGPAGNMASRLGFPLPRDWKEEK